MKIGEQVSQCYAAIYHGSVSRISNNDNIDLLLAHRGKTATRIDLSHDSNATGGSTKRGQHKLRRFQHLFESHAITTQPLIICRPFSTHTAIT